MPKTKIKKETVCFVVEGEFLTNLTRQLWADEGNPEKAFNILNAAFPTMTKGDQFSILIGEKKLIGDSKKGCKLIKDIAKKSPCGNPLSIDRVFKRFRKKLKQQEDWIQLATDNVIKTGSPEGLIAIPKGRAEAYKKGKVSLEDFPYKKIEVYIPDLPAPPKIPLNSIEVAAIPKPPKAHNTIDNDHGWLSTDGKFYPCGYGEHILLADLLGFEERELEKKQWMKIQKGEFWLPDKQNPTQTQYDMLFDWYTKRGKVLPSWLEV